MTNQRDLDEWWAVDKGGTPTWRTIIGTTEAPWLTPKGRKLVARITADLQRIVGDEWVGRAFERRETGVSALLARMSPALNPRGPATGMVDLAVFWLAITSTSDFPGHADVIKTIKTDLRPEAFGHGLTQFRIATLARAAGTSQLRSSRRFREIRLTLCSTPLTSQSPWRSTHHLSMNKPRYTSRSTVRTSNNTTSWPIATESNGPETYQRLRMISILRQSLDTRRVTSPLQATPPVWRMKLR